MNNNISYSQLKIYYTECCLVDLYENFHGFQHQEDADMLAVSTSSQPFDSKANFLTGWLFLAFGFIFFLGFFYAAVLSKLLPPSDNQIISAIQNDRYYCFLVPITLPVLVIAIYFHWLSMKLFKHA